ncbi:MAG: DUF2971 domain-containing protein [Planctomycetota bacterium]|jgi:hypothetical protein
MTQMEYPEVKHLYKYYAYNENSLAVLINKKIWVATPESFNDPFDCGIEFEDDTDERLLENVLGRININPKQAGETKQFAIERLNRLKETYFSNVRIFSMSENNDNILMWSHYAEQHKGFCIEFIRESDNNLGNFEMAKPINYTEDYTKVKFLDSTGNVSKSIASDSFYTKSRDWHYEKEWRLFYTEGDGEKPIPSAISSIIFGLKMTEQNENTIRKILSGQGINYKKAVKADNQFKVDIIDLPE